MEIRIPEVGESVVEALVGKWYRKDGDQVLKDQPLCEVETDKITLDITAEVSGRLRITVNEGLTVPVGTVIGIIKEEEIPESVPKSGKMETSAPLSPAVRKLAKEKGGDPRTVTGTGRGGRGTVADLSEKEGEAEGKGEAFSKGSKLQDTELTPSRPSAVTEQERSTRKRMSPIRRRIAERLGALRREAAPLTTFSEVDMTRVLSLRKRQKEDFMRKHGVALGFMPFFVKASVIALQEFPQMNASIDGDDILFYHFYDIGIAVSGEKGLVVPVLREADRLHFSEIERQIAGFSERVKSNRLAIAEMEGGTFTITNGGVFGSLLSTPLINPPQSGVLGMHAVQDRPVARDGEVVIRPMMYLALSYDHRLVDGREAVLFLRKVKECIENPEEMLPEI